MEVPTNLTMISLLTVDALMRKISKNCPDTLGVHSMAISVLLWGSILKSAAEPINWNVPDEPGLIWTCERNTLVQLHG